MPARPASHLRSRGLALFVGLAALAGLICVFTSAEGSELRLNADRQGGAAACGPRWSISAARRRSPPAPARPAASMPAAASTAWAPAWSSIPAATSSPTTTWSTASARSRSRWPTSSGTSPRSSPATWKPTWPSSRSTPPKTLPVIPLGTSSDLMPGETVIAVGNAYGYEHTVTRGIVSALHRAVQVSDAQFYDDLIQTDASINPGQLGRAAVEHRRRDDRHQRGGAGRAQGIGFAIPVDKAMAVAAELLAACNAQARPGTAWRSPTDAGATQHGHDRRRRSSQKSPAAEAGLQPATSITAVGDTEIKRPLGFPPGDARSQAGRASCSWPCSASGEAGDAEPHAWPSCPRRPSRRGQPAWELLGLELQADPGRGVPPEVPDPLSRRADVIGRAARQPGRQPGHRAGDVLVGMHIWETVSLENVAYILKRPDFDQPQPGEVLHPPRQRDALRLPAADGEDGAAVAGRFGRIQAGLF